MQLLSPRGKTIITPLSAALTTSTTVSTVAGSRAYSQDQRWAHNDTNMGSLVWGMAAVATAGVLRISTSQTLCESDPVDDSAEDNEPEIDPYDNLPEEDEPTHCSICMTYRQGPCRPYWRKVEACTKDGEKSKKEEGEEEESSSPDEPSTRCFKYMMPWIDCASQYRNLYTLIEMDTNYTEGVEELEATSRHFCWVPGKEPKIDWSNWEQSETKELEETLEAGAVYEETGKAVPLWKTFDPANGDPKFIEIDAKVPATINSGDGILECAYALDQDNNVIGFAYGTKPSELMEDSGKNDDGDEKKSNDDTKGNLDKMVALSIKLVESRTKGFTLAASYTHRIEKTNGDNSPMGLESHLYKSKPFALANIPKLPPLEERQQSFVQARKMRDVRSLR